MANNPSVDSTQQRRDLRPEHDSMAHRRQYPSRLWQGLVSHGRQGKSPQGRRRQRDPGPDPDPVASPRGQRAAAPSILEIDPTVELNREVIAFTINTPDPTPSIGRSIWSSGPSGKADPLPPRALSVGLDGDRCRSGGPFMEFNDTNPACLCTIASGSGALRTLDRPEIGYAVYRTSTPLDENGGHRRASRPGTPAGRFENGARDSTGVPERARVTVPTTLPRRSVTR